jgi:hypothetical protein
MIWVWMIYIIACSIVSYILVEVYYLNRELDELMEHYDRKPARPKVTKPSTPNPVPVVTLKRPDAVRDRTQIRL